VLTIFAFPWRLRLYHCARLVHADLSEYNLLLCPSWQISKDKISVESERTDEDQSLRIVLIDFGQAVERGHPAAGELLKRDLQTVRDFFVKQGIQTLPIDDSEEFVLAPFSANEEGNEILVEEKNVSNDITEDDTWRHSVPGWNDQKVMDELLAKLQAINTATKK
jgi:serine/threonine-protein kinase RIO1